MALDIAKLAATGARVAMGIAGNAKKTATIHMGATGGYDPTTDTTAPTVADIVVEGILYSLAEAEGNGKTIWSTVFLIQGADVPSGLSEANSLTVESSTWNIVNVAPDPVRATVKLGLIR